LARGLADLAIKDVILYLDLLPQLVVAQAQDFVAMLLILGDQVQGEHRLVHILEVLPDILVKAILVVLDCLLILAEAEVVQVQLEQMVLRLVAGMAEWV
jgi:hypothetical protein